MPVDAHCAGVERLEAGEAARQRGLAASRSSGQPQRGAALDAQIEAAQRFHLVLRAGEEAPLAIRLRGAGDLGNGHVP